MPLKLSEHAILAAQIVPMDGPGATIRYVAMVSVSKGKTSPGVWAHDEGQSFPTPGEALDWLRQMLGSTALLGSIEPPR
jgi:hypothetical protein